MGACSGTLGRPWPGRGGRRVVGTRPSGRRRARTGWCSGAPFATADFEDGRRGAMSGTGGGAQIQAAPPAVGFGEGDEEGAWRG